MKRVEIGNTTILMNIFKEIKTSRGTFNLPTIIEDEKENIKHEVSYQPWENHGKCRIYIKGFGNGYIEIMADSTVKVHEAAQYMILRRMQEAIGFMLNGKYKEVEVHVI